MTQTMDRTPVSEPAGQIDATTATTLRRLGGLAGIIGAVVMATGAVLMFTAGSDWFTAATDRTVDEFLTDVATRTTTMYVHLTLWIIGASLMSLASAMLASSTRVSAASVIARFAATAAAGAVIVFFPLMIGVIYGLAGHPEQDLAGTAMIQGVIVADDIATVLILGVAAPLAALSGRGTWAPRWLLRIASLNAVIAALYFLPVALIGDITGNLLVLTGLIQMIAMGIVALRGRVSEQL